MEDVTKAIGRLELAIANLDQKMDRRFDALEARFDAKFEARFGLVDSRMASMETRFNQNFLWLLGTEILILVAVIGGLFGVVTKLL